MFQNVLIFTKQQLTDRCQISTLLLDKSLSKFPDFHETTTYGPLPNFDFIIRQISVIFPLESPKNHKFILEAKLFQGDISSLIQLYSPNIATIILNFTSSITNLIFY